MRHWSLDASSEDTFSPHSPYSPSSQRNTNPSLRALPTNVDRLTGHKTIVSPSFAFPTTPADWNASICSSSLDGSFTLPSQAASQHARVLSHGFEGRHRRKRNERENEEEEILMGSARSRLLPPMGDTEDDGNEEEGGSPRGVRLSRHIPQREGVDMSVSTFNLLEATALASNASTPPPQSAAGPHPASMSGASFLLSSRASRARATTAPVNPGQPAPPFVSASVPTPSASASASLTDSQISDDSSFMTSLYNDILADKLTRSGDGGRGAPGTAAHHPPYPVGSARDGRASESGSSHGRSSGEGCGPGSAALSSGRGASTIVPRHRGLGGEVLRFGGGAGASPRGIGGSSAGGASGSCPSSADRRPQPSTSTPGSRSAGGSGSLSLVSHAQMSRRRAGTSGGGGRSDVGSRHSRALCTNPERVLDAPEFPTNNSAHLIDWGSNNKLIIGLKSSLYAWDSETGSAAKMIDLQGGLQIDCVQWLHKCACVALSVGGGTVAIYDCRSEDFLRTVRLPASSGVTGIAVNGPVMAVSSNGATGLTQAFDLRARNALVATYEGHAGPVTAMQYCNAEPYYLATGGQDGHVRVWDSRRSQAIRYAYDNVHRGAVTALHWHPDRRSRLFSGGDDGVLALIDTHASARTMDGDDGLGDEESNGPFYLGLGGGSTSGSTMGTAGGVRPCTGSATSSSGGGAGQHAVTRAVKSMFPISGMAVHNGEVVTSHRGQGQLQLRKASSFQLLGIFSAPNCTQSLSCLTLSPDRQVVCAAQEDETLKFWRVFDGPPPSSATGDGSEATASPRSDGRHRRCEQGGRGLPMSRGHCDPVSRLDEQLR